MKPQDFRAKLPRTRLALREMVSELRDRRLWLVVAGVIGLLVIAGPFYTLDRLGFVARLAYWGGVGLISWLFVWALVRVVLVLTPATWPRPVAGVLAGLVAILPVMGLVALGNLASGMGLPAGGFWALAPYVAWPTLGITVLAVVLIVPEEPPRTEVSDALASGLYARLPPRLGHEIVALRAQDHYIEVITTLGRDLVLLRMGDAVGDLAHLPGLQVHRSWWVNLDHVTELRSLPSGRLEIVTSTGTEVPVPRARQAEIRRIVARHHAPRMPGPA